MNIMKNSWFKYVVLLMLCMSLTGCKMGGRTHTVVLKDEKKQNGQLLRSDKIYQYDFRSYSEDVVNFVPAVWGEDENTIIVLLNKADGSGPRLQKVDYRFGFFEDYGKVPKNINNIYCLSPGGRYMVYSMVKGEKMLLAAADLVTGKTTELMKLSEYNYNYFQPVYTWSGDGKSFYFTKEAQGESTIGSPNQAGDTAVNIKDFYKDERRVMKFDTETNTVKEIERLTEYYNSLQVVYNISLTASYDGDSVMLDCLSEKVKLGAVYTQKDEKIYYVDDIPYGQIMALQGNQIYFIIQGKELGVINFKDADNQRIVIKKSFSGFILNAVLLPTGRGMVVQTNLDKTVQTVYYDNDMGDLKNEKLLYQVADRGMDMIPNPQGTGIMLLENTGSGGMIDYGIADNYKNSSAMILKF